MRRGSYDAAEIKPHLRGLAQRRRSAPSVVFEKVLAKSWPSIREDCVPAIMIDQSPFVLGLSNEDSELILDDIVQFTEGLNTRKRHVFLFSDVLVIAKLKSSGSYKLKHRVNLEQLWVCDFRSESDEGCKGKNKASMIDQYEKTLVLAWSVSLCLVTFSLPEVKERWLDTVHRKIKEARKRTVKISSLPSVLMKVLSSTTTNKALSGGVMEDSAIDNALHGNGNVSTLQCKMEPVIEHDGGKKSLFSKLKRRDTHTGIPERPGHKTNLLFGQPLPEDAKIPKPIADVLKLLWRKGPDTEGVFRIPCNSKNLNAVLDQLNSGVAVDLEALPVTLLVGLLKAFLRELPGSLLVAKHYAQWIKALEKEEIEERHAELRRIVSTLPKANIVLLKYLLCLLCRIIQQSEKNKMDPKNLATCIGPTLLQINSQDVSTFGKVTTITQYLIENCGEIFGEKTLTLLGNSEKELEYNSDTTSSHHHDSAYESIDGENGEATGHTQQTCPHIQIQYSVNHSHSSEDIFETLTKPFDRRSSEPAIFSTVGVKDRRYLARSHDDCSSAKEYEEQTLKKQNSDDSFLQPQRRPLQPLLRKTTGSLNLEVPVITKTCSCSSTCSLESTNSNVSDNSVFANSPLPSPSSPRKIQPERHMSQAKSKMDTNSTRRPFPFKRAKSLGSFSISRASSKKTESQKEGTFPCGTLQEDSQNEAEVPDEPVRRQRPLSAIEVFDHVDRRDPGSPPSYQQAVISGVLPAPPGYHSMTVHDAREQRSRPISMNEFILDSSSCQILDNFNFADNGLDAPMQSSFRQRAMSESIGCTRIEKLSRRCSQPVFEELSYAKESYV
ncbi:T cell activation RhoGTPase activating protein b [Silurus meridionalis]|uniref:T cell activation RhoGTPase activating protein b n=1 Tax=Silurus meridionalis TaxID=175797 RepID=UPI001EEBCE03|nr:T cell activation RhoGTPase activating protein b [Silurus meridionalis]